MEKYLKYLYREHDYQGINCLTLIEQIYLELLNINFFEMWHRVGTAGNSEDVSSRWKFLYKHKIIEELTHWKKIELVNIKEYDILVFNSKKKDLINHFGMYIGENKFIHISENRYSQLSELNQDYRDVLFGVFRHPDVV
tara:strand:+ start:2299 stop:2715 length:417 start_codon:yes stop_codon:yes gene_type:complete